MTRIGSPFLAAATAFLFTTLTRTLSRVQLASHIMSHRLFAVDKNAGVSPSFTVQFCQTEPCGVKNWGKKRKGGAGFEAGTRCQSQVPVCNTSTAKIFGVGTVMQVINGFAPIVVDPMPPAFLK